MKHLHKLFVVIAVIGFIGMFFIATSSDSGNLTANQLIILCIISALCMSGGLAGYISTVEVHIK